MNNKISVVFIAFMLLLNVSYVYSDTVVVFNTTANNSIKIQNTSKSDIINYSSFKQISKNLYDSCSKIRINIQNDMYSFVSPLAKHSSINNLYKVMHFSEKPVEYAFSSVNLLYYGVQPSVFINNSSLNNMFGGFNAIFAFVMAMFMLFLCALYKGSVPNSAITIINNVKTRCFC